MPILEDFCKDVKPIGKITLAGGEYFHWVWPSQGLVEASKDEKTLAAYKEHGEKMVKLGVSGIRDHHFGYYLNLDKLSGN